MTEEVKKEVEPKDVIAIEHFGKFLEELNECVKHLRFKKMNKPTKYKFQKKVRKVVAKYFNISLSETKEILFVPEGDDMLIKYPINDSYMTLLRFEIVK